MMVDKQYCMSSFMAFRCIIDDDKDFYEGMSHRDNVFRPVAESEKIPCKTAEDIHRAIAAQFEQYKGKKLGIMLSGGIDSGILAYYMKGCDAYTFRFLGGEFQQIELERAKRIADANNMTLHYVDIDWKTVEDNVDAVMETKNSPVHSIEPQILAAAKMALADGVEVMIVGESSDLIFGGMDLMLSKDWTYEEWVKRYTFTEPAEVLREPVDMTPVYEPYRLPDGKADYLRFMDDIFAIESSSSYLNAFRTAGLAYFDPYAKLVMAEPLDLVKCRSGEPKYLVRELYHMLYPSFDIPFKIPMPRPVDAYFADWAGPTRPEFRTDIDMSKYTGNQKWQMWCLERFLNKYE